MMDFTLTSIRVVLPLLVSLNEEGKQGSGATSVVQQGSGPGHRDFFSWSGLDSCDDDDWGGEAGDLSPTSE